MPKQVAPVAKTGDRLKTLQALRDRLAEAIDREPDASELSSLALRLQRVLADIHELGGQVEDDDNDELSAARAAKLRAATRS